MLNVTWNQNSYAMYRAVIDGTPFFFRGMIERKIADWVTAQGLTVITEADVFRAVHELAPKGMAESKILPELNKIKTV